MSSTRVYVIALAACVAVPGAGSVQSAAADDVYSEVIFYPAANQSTAQQDRDRYECYLWAVKQTGFDPSQPGLQAQQRVAVVRAPAPSGPNGTVTGAVAGAVLGAVIGSPHDTGEGAAVGAVTGAVIGSAADANRRAGIEDARRREESRAQAQQAQVEAQASRYRRAMSACLEGRGYTVR